MTPAEAELHAMAADLTDEAGLRPHEAYRVLHGYPILTPEQRKLARAFCADLADVVLRPVKVASWTEIEPVDLTGLTERVSS